MLDRLKENLTEIILRVVRFTQYHRLVPCTVVHQDTDGTLHLSPVDPIVDLPGLVGVPIRHGLPGVTAVAVQAGAVVRVGFDQGDPRKPFAVLWNAGSATSITFNGSTQQLARTRDTVDCGTLVFSPTGTFVAYAPPGAAPSVPPGGSTAALTGSITGTSMVSA